MCAAVIRGGRSKEIERGVKAHQAKGGAVMLLTLTLRHRRGDDLAAMLGYLADSWRAVTAHKGWKTRTRALGYVGYIKALEVTVGDNGWHPHLHFLLLTERLPDDEERVDLVDWLAQQWAMEVSKRGGRMPSKERGVDLRVAEGGTVVAKYVAKVQEKDGSRWSVAAEVSRGDVKEGRQGSRTPFELLDSPNGHTADRELWLQYVKATKGRNAIVWSRGLKSALGVNEKTDEEILDDTEKAPRVVRVSADAWRAVRDLSLIHI